MVWCLFQMMNEPEVGCMLLIQVASDSLQIDQLIHVSLRTFCIFLNSHITTTMITIIVHSSDTLAFERILTKCNRIVWNYCRPKNIYSPNTTGSRRITRRMAIANGTCVSLCTQPKAHYLVTSRESRRYVVSGAGIWLRQESLRHILASPEYAPGTIAISFIWMKREFNACQMYRSMYTSSTVSQ